MFKNLLVPVLMCCTALVACGGGGNIQENLAAMDANNGGSPPPANDPSDEFETGEYLANWGLDTVNPVPAWEAGITGQGVVVAIIDSGIDDTHEDIDDNIHPNSSYTGDVGGQGTFIAGLIAGERNTTGTHGVAYDAQILAVQSGSTSDQIAASIDYAVANGADVINISIGEATVPNATLLTALENAALADIVVIFNAGDSNLSYTKTTVPTVIPNTPTQLAMTAILDIANGQFLIVGASNKGNTALFLQADRDPDENDPDWWDVHATNRAGETGSAYYLMAPGWDIYSTMAGGENLYEFRNDSAVAAPMVSAAAALLKQNFPNLTADEIVNILIKTATDITDARWVPDPDPLNPMGMVNTALPGADEYYGHGLLNIGAALAPIGTNSVVIKTESGWITTELADAGLVSGGVFGDGVGSGFARGAIFLDDYDRAYKTTFSSQILNASPFMDFDNRFDTAREYRHGNLALTPDLYISVAANYEVPVSTYEQDVFGLQDEDVVITDNVSVRLVKELGNKSAVSMAVGGSLSSVLSFGNHDTGYANSVSLSEGMNDPWISSNRSLNYADGQRIAIIHSLTDTLTLSVGLSSDIVASPDYFDSADFGADAERHVVVTQLAGREGRLGWKTLVGQVTENGTVLDSHSTGALSLGQGAETTFVSLGTEYALTNRIRAFGRIGQSYTDVEESQFSAFSRFDMLRASHFAAGVTVGGIFAPASVLSLSVSQPLRLERGTATVNVASGYDYSTETPNFSSQVNGLTPSGRELDFEAAWRYGVGRNAHISANLLYQSHPGHVEQADNVVSFMLSAKSTF